MLHEIGNLLLGIGDFTLKLWSMALFLVALAAAFSGPAALFALIDLATDPRKPDKPKGIRAWLQMFAVQFASITQEFAVVLIRIVLTLFFNRTSLIGFTIFIGAQAVAAADPTKASECAAVIAMSLLWVVCDSIMHGFMLGYAAFPRKGDETPLHRHITNVITDLVRTYAAIPNRIASRLKAV